MLDLVCQHEGQVLGVNYSKNLKTNTFAALRVEELH